MTKPILNISDVELQPRPAALTPKGPSAERFDSRVGFISARIGAQKLGYNLTAVPPGKRAFPFHNHLVNEEMFFVIEGEGEVRIGEAVYPIRPGDIVACPTGGKETAHQIINTGSVELKYLSVRPRCHPTLASIPTRTSLGYLLSTPPPETVSREYSASLDAKASTSTIGTASSECPVPRLRRPRASGTVRVGVGKIVGSGSSW
jgi:uncharacterized cupin superfamily protein